MINAASLIASLLLLVASASVRAEPEIRALTPVIDGHEVGGLTIDMIGNVYAGDFGDVVWRITPEGERREFAGGMYGTAGNAIDIAGNLLQSSFYGDAVFKIDRKGVAQPFVTRGLNRPVGIAVDRQTGEAFVANCRGNSIVKVAADGSVAPFAQSELFNCPYGIAFDRQRNLYAVNFQDNRMLRIDPQGAVTLFARVSEKGLAHLCFKDNRFYVTAFRSHEVYEVALDKSVKRILGNGERGMVDGRRTTARLSFPMGIACHPWAPRLYVNEDVNEGALPRQSIVRVITLDAPK
jgi:DNA-binding beta-propeller fold protein YncE